MNRIGRGLGIGAALLAAVFIGCGGDDEDSKGGGSYSSIASAIESPTGTVDEATAPEVAVEFEKVASVDAAGGRRQDQTAQSSSGTYDCPAGGSISGSGSGNQSSGHAVGSYDNCCFTEGCCVDGTVDYYYSTESTADYSMCGSYDLSYSCEGTTADLSYEGCIGTMGQLYVIEVDGDTYTVSGSYANGSGSLTIRGENGSWTCTYSNGGGSCTGSGGDFDF